jgi:hypothetical protein
MPHELTMVEFVEDVTEEVHRRMMEDIHMLQKLHGERPAFTTKMTAQEKLMVWMEAEKLGPQGWLDFYQARRDEGLSNESAQYEMLKLNKWAQDYLDEHPKAIEEAENAGSNNGLQQTLRGGSAPVRQSRADGAGASERGVY